MQNRVKAILKIVMLVVLSAACSEKPQSENHVKQINESILVETLAGAQFDLIDLRGDILIVDFWATWCKPCISEIPEYNHLSEKYKNKGVKLIGIAMASGNGNKIQQSVEKYEITYPIYNSNNRAPSFFGNIEAFPTTFILDMNFNILTKIVGSAPGKINKIESIIAGLQSK